MGGPLRQLCLKSEETVLRWFIILVQPGYEVSVKRNLDRFEDVSVVVPYRTEVRQWADRKVVRQRPLLPGYVIARSNPELRGQIVSLPRVYQFLRFGGEAAYLTEEEVEAVRRVSERTVDPESWDKLQPGQAVRILDGPLAGCAGEIVERDRNQYFTIRLPMLGRQIATRVDLSETGISLLPGTEART